MGILWMQACRSAALSVFLSHTTTTLKHVTWTGRNRNKIPWMTYILQRKKLSIRDILFSLQTNDVNPIAVTWIQSKAPSASGVFWTHFSSSFFYQPLRLTPLTRWLKFVSWKQKHSFLALENCDLKLNIFFCFVIFLALHFHWKSVDF